MSTSNNSQSNSNNPAVEKNRWDVGTDEATNPTDSADQLGHGRYVDALEELIAAASEGSTIGLFGAYGTGKSWIVERLTKKLNKFPDYAVFSYDAWRYADDEIRRDMLVTLKDQLSKNPNVVAVKDLPKIDESTFTNDFTLTTKGPNRLTVKALGGALKESMWVGVALTFLGGIAGLLFGISQTGWGKSWPFFHWSDVWPFASTGLAFGIGWAVNAARSLLAADRVGISETTSSHRPKVELAEEFTSMFYSLLKSVTAKKIVIIVDNLDRCSPEVALKVLATIKNFLEPTDRRVFFIIPCDIKALHRHLKAVFVSRGVGDDDASRDSDEYLRKFFRTSLAIGSASGGELANIAIEVLETTAAGKGLTEAEIQNVAGLAASANRNSPREVKDFLNGLSTSMLLLKHSGSDEATKLDLATVAKLSAFQQKTPSLWSLVEQDPLILAKAETLTPVGSRSDNEELNKLVVDETLRLVRALRRQSVTETQIRVYLGHRIPAEGDGFSRYFDFLGAVADSNFELLEEISNGASPAVLHQMVSAVLREMDSVSRDDPARAINPSASGIWLLTQEGLRSDDRRALLTRISDVGLDQPASLSGPELVSQAAALSAKDPESGMLRIQLIKWLGDSDESIRSKAEIGLKGVVDSTTPQEIEVMKKQVTEGMDDDWHYESRIRQLPASIRQKVLADSWDSITKTLLFTENVSQPRDHQEQMASLHSHADIIPAEVLDYILQSADERLKMRCEAGQAFGAEDSELLESVVSLAEASKFVPIDCVSRTISAWIARPEPTSIAALCQQLAKIEPILKDESISQLVALVDALLRGSLAIPRPEGISMAEDLLLTCSGSTRQSVLAKLGAHLAATDDELSIETAIQLSKSSKDFGPLNRALGQRGAAQPSSYEWLYGRIRQQLDIKELATVTRGSISGLIGHLDNEALFIEATNVLIGARSGWRSDDSHLIAEKAHLRISSGDAGVAEKASVLIDFSSSSHKIKNIMTILKTVVESLITGPLGLDGPEALFKLQMESLTEASPTQSLQLRGNIRQRLTGNHPAQHDRTFGVIRRLLELDSEQHSDDLYRPIIDYGLIVNEPERKSETLSLLGTMTPSKSEIARSRGAISDLEDQLTE